MSQKKYISLLLIGLTFPFYGSEGGPLKPRLITNFEAAFRGITEAEQKAKNEEIKRQAALRVIRLPDTIDKIAQMEMERLMPGTRVVTYQAVDHYSLEARVLAARREMMVGQSKKAKKRARKRERQAQFKA